MRSNDGERFVQVQPVEAAEEGGGGDGQHAKDERAFTRWYDPFLSSSFGTRWATICHDFFITGAEIYDLVIARHAIRMSLLFS